jgi:hypothetical protein
VARLALPRDERLMSRKQPTPGGGRFGVCVNRMRAFTGFRRGRFGFLWILEQDMHHALPRFVRAAQQYQSNAERITGEPWSLIGEE